MFFLFFFKVYTHTHTHIYIINFDEANYFRVLNIVQELEGWHYSKTVKSTKHLKRHVYYYMVSYRTKKLYGTRQINILMKIKKKNYNGYFYIAIWYEHFQNLWHWCYICLKLFYASGHSESCSSSFEHFFSLPVLLLWSPISFWLEVSFPHFFIHCSPVTKRPQVIEKCWAIIFKLVPLCGLAAWCLLSTGVVIKNLTSVFSHLFKILLEHELSELWELKSVDWFKDALETSLVKEYINTLIMYKIRRKKYSAIIQHAKNTWGEFNVFINRIWLPFLYIVQLWFLNAWRSVMQCNGRAFE